MYQKYAKEIFNTQSAEVILPLVFNLFPVQSAIDVGCGNGSWLLAAQKLGVKEILGLDGSHVKDEELLIDRKYFQIQDFTKGEFNLNKQFDLVISLEVAEHLPEESSDIFVKSLTNHGKAILFSAAIPGQGGYMHVNEQYHTYWVEKFARHNYKFYDVIRPFIWHNSNVMYWYRQNIYLLLHSSIKPPNFDTLPILFDTIHPELFEAKIKKIKQLESYNKDILDGVLGVKSSIKILINALKRKIYGS